MKIVRKIEQGELMPGWYGLVRYDYCRQVTVVAPVPLNIIMGVGLAIWTWLRWGYLGVHQNPRDAFRQGWLAGYAGAVSETGAERKRDG